MVLCKTPNEKLWLEHQTVVYVLVVVGFIPMPISDVLVLVMEKLRYQKMVVVFEAVLKKLVLMELLVVDPFVNAEPHGSEAI